MSEPIAALAFEPADPLAVSPEVAKAAASTRTEAEIRAQRAASHIEALLAIMPYRNALSWIAGYASQTLELGGLDHFARRHLQEIGNRANAALSNAAPS